MKIVIFGLSISSSWGNGHATLWRGLCRELAARGHTVVFFERDTDYYRKHRDYNSIPGGRLVLYDGWPEIAAEAARELGDADVGMVTSYCPDGIDATDMLMTSACGLQAFYDLDTPVTLDRIERGETLSYVGPGGYSGFDLVLSYTGGKALDRLKSLMGARTVEPLYGSIDPVVHKRVPPVEEYQADFSYLGTYAADRQPALEELFLKPAQKLSGKRFLIGGPQYPQDFPWQPNIFYREHVPPQEHPGFYSSSPVTLNITRAAMAHSGWCPSGRLFEAAGCRTAVVSDSWDGLDHFYEPDKEIFLCNRAEEVEEVMKLPASEIQRAGDAAYERTMRSYTAAHRAAEFESIIQSGLLRKHQGARAAEEVPVCGV
jgi:spore maturation protein CgeB